METERHPGLTRAENHRVRLWPRVSSGVVIALACVQLGYLPNTHAQDLFPDYQVKAAYLFNFIKFAEWPDNAFADPLAPIVIGIAGDDPFGNSLPQVITGKTVQGRDLVIHRFSAGENLQGCQILFIDVSEKKRFPQLLAGLRGSSVLTVADVDGFLEMGGMIQLLSENNRVRFAINVDAATRANLKISSKLLALARVPGPRDK